MTRDRPAAPSPLPPVAPAARRAPRRAPRRALAAVVAGVALLALLAGAPAGRAATAPPSPPRGGDRQATPRAAVANLKRAWKKGLTAERLLALDQLQRFDDPLCAEALIDILEDAEVALFPAARRLLSGYRGPRTLAVMVAKGLEHRDAGVRAQVLLAFGLGRPAGVDWVGGAERVLDDPDARVRAAAVSALGSVRADGRLDRILALAADRAERVRQEVPGAVARLAGNRALPVLVSLGGDPRWRVRLAAGRALADLKTPEAVAALAEALGRETGRLREDFHALLVRLTGEDKGLDLVAWRAFLASAPGDFLARADEIALNGRAEVPRYAEGAAHYYSIATLSRRFALLTDTSGSMETPVHDPSDGGSRSRMALTQAELTRLIGGLDESQRFDLVPFDSTASPWQGRLVAADSRQKRAAIAEVARWSAGGGTNMYAALALVVDAAEAAMDSPVDSDETPDTVFLLSDGAPTEGEVRDTALLAAWLSERNRALHLRIHCVSLTSEGESRDFLQRLAQEFDGRYVEITGP